MKSVLFYIPFLLFISCDAVLQPEITLIEEDVRPESDSGFTCILVVEDQPELITPKDSLYAEYAKILSKFDYEGRVIVEFIIDKKGSVEDPKIVYGGVSVVNQEVKEIIKSLKFKPAMQRGRPVKVSYSIPLSLTY